MRGDFSNCRCIHVSGHSEGWAVGESIYFRCILHAHMHVAHVCEVFDLACTIELKESTTIFIGNINLIENRARIDLQTLF